MYGKLELKDYNLQFRKYAFHKVEDKDVVSALVANTVCTLKHCTELTAVGILCHLMSIKVGQCYQQNS